MKPLFLVACCLVIGALALAQGPGDENAVRAVFQKMNDAWKNDDYGYTHNDLLDDDAVLINPIGSYWKGKAEIAKALQYLGEVRFRYEKSIEDSILSIRFLSPSSAFVVVHNIDEIEQDFTMPGEIDITRKGERFASVQTFTLVKNKLVWRITSITATEIVKGLR